MNRISLLIIVILLSACKKTNNNLKIINSNIEAHNDYECKFDSIQLKTSEYEDLTFYSENILRGKGVIQAFINQKIIFLNLDKTEYGSISLVKNQDELISYKIDLPKKNIIAREIIPDLEFQVFTFDAEIPNKNKPFITIYINREKKLIKKNDLKYQFLTWDEYIKSAYLQLDSDIKNVNKDELKYWYKALKINNDSMLIKTVSKTDCDYVEEYKDISKWIIWKKNNCKLIKLNFCY